MKKHSQEGIGALIVFAAMVLISVRVFNSISTNAATIVSSSQGLWTIGNSSSLTYSAFGLIATSPIVLGAVIVLGIVGLLYLRK